MEHVTIFTDLNYFTNFPANCEQFLIIIFLLEFFTLERIQFSSGEDLMIVGTIKAFIMFSNKDIETLKPDLMMEPTELLNSLQ